MLQYKETTRCQQRAMSEDGSNCQNIFCSFFKKVCSPENIKKWTLKNK